MPTLTQHIADIATMLPYSTSTFTDAWILRRMNAIVDQVWRLAASTGMYSFDTVAAQAIYTLSTDVVADQIKSVQVSNTTTIDGTEGYTEYTYAGQDDEMDDNHWYDGLDDYQIGLYPVPSTDGSGYRVRVIYEARPATLSTGNMSAVPQINVEYQDILKYGVMRDIARSGNAPDVELANNYQAEYDEIYRKIRMNVYRRRAKNPKEQWDYRAGWWNG